MFFCTLQSPKKFLHKISFFSNLIHHCLSLPNPSNSFKPIHSQLIKLGLHSNTYLGNRCIDLYLKSNSLNDALKAFHDIPIKNIVSWNLYLKFHVKCFDIVRARRVFDEMPERDVVSWNTIISGYISSGFLDSAWEMFLDLRHCCVRPSEYTFSMALGCVKCGDFAKEMHGFIMRNGGCYSNLVVGNSLIDAYGKLGLVDYSLAVFWSLEKVDLVSWNSVISGCCKSGYDKYSLHMFCLMRSMGFKVDEFTVSAVLIACSYLRNLEKGKQMLCLCMKIGLLRNTIVSSSAIDLFSKCNRVESAISVFKESYVFDSAICNSMIACYANHDLEENAFELFVFSFRESIRPTEFTLSSVLYSVAVFIPVEWGGLLHSLVIKTGFESDTIVASSLVQMYSKYGLIDSALNVFKDIVCGDLIAWNTMILALTHNGKLVEAIHLFKDLVQSDLNPDQITFSAVLLACNYGGFLEEGMAILSSMQKKHEVIPSNEHYASIVDTMIRAGRLDGANNLLHSIQFEPNALIWESLLRACVDSGDLNLTERVAERLMELDLHSSLPYLILANTYEKKGRWESLVRVRNKMEKMAIIKEIVDCSWIGVKGQIFSFEANQLIHFSGKNVYLVLGLLMPETWDENDLSNQT